MTICISIKGQASSEIAIFSSVIIFRFIKLIKQKKNLITLHFVIVLQQFFEICSVQQSYYLRAAIRNYFLMSLPICNMDNE